ncbi:hypothetical protein [Trueperella abortisuis]|uniref:hypothetical protein n=1 Tax=Trueperella abortisuis TaxID=445930 RepID=UPI0028936DC9|nr:hypothetical protein [Trueperella abortisuis]
MARRVAPKQRLALFLMGLASLLFLSTTVFLDYAGILAVVAIVLLIIGSGLALSDESGKGNRNDG